MSDWIQRRKEAIDNLARHGLSPGEWDKYRAFDLSKLPPWPDDEALAEYILCDALTQEGVIAWPGDATGCVSQIVRAYHRKAEQSTRRVDDMTRALEPFAKVADEVLSCGCGGNGHAVRMAPECWRAARAALASGESGETKG